MRFIVKRYIDFRNQLLLEFLELQEVFAKYNMSQIRSRAKSDYKNDIISFKTQTEDDKKYIQLLENLNKKKEERTKIYTQIREFINAGAKLSSRLINISFTGDANFPGLLEICGEHEGDVDDQSSHLICSYGLNLLNDIMQFEYNQKADLFLNIFQQQRQGIVKKLNFTKHILTKCNNKCKDASLRLLKKYLDKQHQTDSSLLNFIVGNQETVLVYQKWLGLSLNQNIKFQQQVVQKHSDDMTMRQTSQQIQQKRISNQIKTSNNLDFDFETNNKRNMLMNSDQKSQQQIYMSDVNFTDTYTGNENEDNISIIKEEEHNQNSSPTQKLKKNSLKKTMINMNKTNFTNVKDLAQILDMKKQVPWKKIYNEQNIKVKRTDTPDSMLKISIIFENTASEVAEVFLDNKQAWDNILKEQEILEQIDENSKIVKQTHIWNKSKGVNFITETMHIETRRKNESCIYQYQQPVERDIKLIKDAFIGKCLTVIRIKDFNKEGDQNNIHKESGLSNLSQNGADITSDSIKQGVSKCKVKILKKYANLQYTQFLSPLLLQESFQYLDRYKNIHAEVAKHVLQKKQEEQQQPQQSVKEE